MVLVKTLIIFTLLTARVCHASDSRKKKNLRTNKAVRDLFSYETVTAFVNEGEKNKKDDKSNKMEKVKSNTIHFVSSGNTVGLEPVNGSTSGYINYGFSKGKGKGKGSTSGYVNYGYSKGDITNSPSAYVNHGYGKGDSKSVFLAKGSSNILENKISGEGSTKNVKSSPLGYRPLSDRKPSKGDGHQPTNMPAFAEPFVTPKPTLWNGDGHPPKPELVVTPQPTPDPTPQPSNHPSPHPTDLPSRRPTDQPTNRPTKKPTQFPVTLVVSPKPTENYYNNPAPTMLEQGITAKPTNAYIQPTPGHTVNITKPMLPGGQFRKEVDEQCDEVVMGDPEACVVRCVTVTSIFDGDMLIDETSRVSETSCLNKRQQAKQNNRS